MPSPPARETAAASSGRPVPVIPPEGTAKMALFVSERAWGLKVKCGGSEGWTYHDNGVIDVQHLRDACFYGHFYDVYVVVRMFFFPARVTEALLDAPAVFSAAR